MGFDFGDNSNNRVPYVNSNSKFVTSPALTFNDNNDTFQLGSGTQNVQLKLLNTLSTSTIAGSVNDSFIAQSINLGLTSRTIDSSIDSPTYTGLKVEFDSLGTGSEQGYLSEGETAVGIQVDLSSLLGTTYSVDNGGNLVTAKGKKYSAVFSGGSVGVGIVEPNALLHIKQENQDQPIFRIDSVTQNYRLFVDNLGKVGVGTGTPVAQLDILAPHNATSLFRVNSSNVDVLLTLGILV